LANSRIDAAQAPADQHDRLADPLDPVAEAIEQVGGRPAIGAEPPAMSLIAGRIERRTQADRARIAGEEAGDHHHRPAVATVARGPAAIGPAAADELEHAQRLAEESGASRQ